MRALLVVAGLSLPLLSSLATGCDGCDPAPPDDGAARADAGGRALADAGDSDDGGARRDSGAGDDAGALSDGGAALDAGRALDAGEALDSGAEGDDAGALTDDGGHSNVADAGAVADAGVVADAGDDVVVGPCGSAGLALRLSWSTVGDLDLHLSLDGAAWCSDEDCFWANCRPDADPRREWDNVAGASAGDPVLVTDTAAGFGPEVLCIDAPFVAAYVVGVRYQPFSGWPATDARLELFSGGVLVDEVTLSGFAPGEYWQPGSVEVSAGAVSLAGVPRRCEVSDGWICQDPPGDCPPLP